MNNQFKQALTLLRDLADMQNGAPLIRYEKEYNELIKQVYDFLNDHEAPFEPLTEIETGIDLDSISLNDNEISNLSECVYIDING